MVEFSEIEQRTNLFVVSGSVKISAVKKVVDVASCKFMPGTAYAGARGQAVPVTPMCCGGNPHTHAPGERARMRAVCGCALCSM